jgi:glycine/D-amino acid oxidase-like deaminating enzyme/nitrite reductase/ring-hydroxylating ferredoxin subunit
MYNPHQTSGDTETCWENPVAVTSNVLPGAADVVVIGAGMAGLSTAYHLLHAGRSVVVIDKGGLRVGETARTTAHLASAVDDHFYLLERMHGREGARLARESHAAGIDSIEAISQREGIACDFLRVDGFLFAARPSHQSELKKEFEAAARAGLSVKELARAPLPFDTGPCLSFARQAQVEPMKYLQGLARAVQERGGLICTNTHVERVEEGTPCVVNLKAGPSIRAEVVVVATNTPVIDRFAMHTKQAPYRTYVIAMEIAPGSVVPGLYWDTGDPYHYIRLQGDNLLIVGGEDHKCGQEEEPEERWRRLEAWTRERFPSAFAVRHRWSGHIQEPADGLAYIGRNPGASANVFIATGDSGNGMTHGALAGLLLTDLICGRENPWAKLYDPSRKVKSMPATREFLKENVNVALQYTDWIRPQNGEHDIPRGHGAVVRRGLHPVAVFVDEQGMRHECSAVCPHLAGVVAWNRAERSWDCPCHGSRFSPYGQVLTGPAASDLTVLKSPTAASDVAPATNAVPKGTFGPGPGEQAPPHA